MEWFERIERGNDLISLGTETANVKPLQCNGVSNYDKPARCQVTVRTDTQSMFSKNCKNPNKDMCYMMKTYLEANHDAFCVSCDYLMVDNFENTLERRYAEKENISCGIMYRKDPFVQVGGYNDKMRHREEEELRKRLGQEYKIHHLRIPFYRYRMHNTNKTKEPEYKTWEI